MSIQSVRSFRAKRTQSVSELNLTLRFAQGDDLNSNR